MWKDDIVEETRRSREEYAAKFDYDLTTITRDLREQQKEGKRQVVRLSPKAPMHQPQEKAS